MMRLIEHCQGRHAVTKEAIDYALANGIGYLYGLHDQLHAEVGATERFLNDGMIIPVLGTNGRSDG